MVKKITGIFLTFSILFSLIAVPQADAAVRTAGLIDRMEDFTFMKSHSNVALKFVDGECTASTVSSDKTGIMIYKTNTEISSFNIFYKGEGAGIAVYTSTDGEEYVVSDTSVTDTKVRENGIAENSYYLKIEFDNQTEITKVEINTSESTDDDSSSGSSYKVKALTREEIIADVDIPDTNTEIIDELIKYNPNKEHPRIFARAEDFERIKEDLKTDTYMQQMYTNLIKRADNYMNAEVAYYHLPDGSRLLDVSRDVKAKMIYLGLAYKLSDDEKYAQRMWTELEAICNFPSWHPEHFLDTAEMGFAAGLGYDWLYDYLTEDQRKTLATAIYNFGIKAGEGIVYSSVTDTSNWNTVITGGLGIAALAIGEEYPEECGNLLRGSIGSIPTALSSVAPDGAYPEGPNYWGYGTSYGCYFVAALDSALGNDHGLSKVPGMKETAKYPMYVYGYGGGTFNYADGGPELSSNPHLYWMAKKYNYPEVAWFNTIFTEDDPMGLIWYDPDYVSDPITAQTPLDTVFRGKVSLATMRSSWLDKRGIFVGLKGGDNQITHGDLDIGAFVFDALGQRWSNDLGAETYDIPGYWNYTPDAGRWKYYRKRAEGHSTIVINPSSGADQNVYAYDNIEKFVSEEGGAYTILNMNNAYSASAISAKRGIMLYDGRTKALIQDELKLREKSEVYWFMQTLADAEISEDGQTAMLSLSGEQMKMQILSPANGRFEIGPAEPLPTSPHPAENSPWQSMKRLSIHLEDVKNTTISVAMIPVYDEYSLTDDLPEVVPMNDWQIVNTQRATLDSLLVDGDEIAGFIPQTYSYEFKVPYGTEDVIPVSATSSYGEVNIQSPETPVGKTVISITPYDEEVKPTTYYVNFTQDSVTEIPEGTVEYKPQSAAASAVPQPENPPAGSWDGDTATRWSAEVLTDSEPQYITYDFMEEKEVGAVSLIWMSGSIRKTFFDVQLSLDGKSWNTVWSGASSGTIDGWEVFTFDAQPARYVRISSTGNTVNKWVSLCEFRCFGPITIERDFSDIANHWANKDIKKIATEKIMLGTSAIKFSPDKSISRAEFMTIAARVLGIEDAAYSGAYSDVTADAWYAGTLQSLSNGGYINSNLTYNGNIYPDDALKRQEMMAFIGMILELNGKNTSSSLAAYTDSGEIADWIRGYAEKTVGSGIIKGVSETELAPNSAVTRAETAVIMNRLLQVIK